MNDRIVRYALPPGAIVPPGAAEIDRLGPAAHWRSPDASLRDRRARATCSSTSARAPTPARRRTARCDSPGHQALHRARDARRHLALRRQQDEPEFSPAERYATGIRNADRHRARPDGPAVFHPARPRPARRELAELYTPRAGRGAARRGAAEDRAGRRLRLAEVLFRLHAEEARAGAGVRRRRRQEVGVCASKRRAGGVLSRALGARRARVLRAARSFPRAYRSGAFIAFHGSWNRAPCRRAAIAWSSCRSWAARRSGAWETFANGFAGAAQPQPTTRAHRPAGLAVGPDGSLYIGDDVGGRIWRVTTRARNIMWTLELAPIVFQLPSDAARRSPARCVSR